MVVGAFNKTLFQLTESEQWHRTDFPVASIFTRPEPMGLLYGQFLNSRTWQCLLLFTSLIVTSTDTSFEDFNTINFSFQKFDIFLTYP
jgi:hypothetical protein